MSAALLFFVALGAFLAGVCLLGVLYRGDSGRLLDWSAERSAQRRAADALDLQTLLDATNRERVREGLEPVSDEELLRGLSDRELDDI